MKGKLGQPGRSDLTQVKGEAGTLHLMHLNVTPG